MVSTGGPNIFVACSYRSGSTHIAHVLSDLLKFRPASMAGMHGEGMDTQNINPFTAKILLPYGYQIFQQHCPASPSNVAILREGNINPIVTIRNIADTLVSIRERVMKFGPVLPGIIVTNEIVDWPEKQQYHWLVSNVTPWLMQFYVSWVTADIPHMRVKFSTFFGDQVGTIKKMLEWLGMDCPPDKDIKKACGRNYNKNVGDVGRGSQVLSADNLLDIEISAKHWGEHWVERMREDELL